MAQGVAEFVRGDSQFFHVMSAFRPETILEVGSWHGRSAVTFVWNGRNLGLKTTVLCVDTWLGSKEHWSDKFPSSEWSRAALELRDGEPTSFEHFKRNIKNFGM